MPADPNERRDFPDVGVVRLTCPTHGQIGDSTSIAPVTLFEGRARAWLCPECPDVPLLAVCLPGFVEWVTQPGRVAEVVETPLHLHVVTDALSTDALSRMHATWRVR
jgi:hypothetical protein